ncbi:MAG: hypothetical protein U0796_08770 [Gemmatales bacterium]
MRVLRSADIVATIDQYLAGQLDAAGLEAWAERWEIAEDVEYANAEREAVVEALYLLANPEINGELTLAHVQQVRADLQVNVG